MLLLSFSSAIAVAEDSAGSPPKFALLIGVEKYANLGPSEQLSGAANDVTLMEQVLTERFGFAETDVQTLVDEQATAAEIRKALHRDASLKVWNTAGQPVREIELPKGPAENSAASSDESTLLIACGAQFDQLNVETLSVMKEHNADHVDGRTTAVALSHNGSRAAIGRVSGHFYVIDYSGDEVTEIMVPKLLNYPRAVDISPDGTLAAACDYGGTLHVFEVDSNADRWFPRKLLSASAHAGRGYSVRFESDAKTVVSAGRDGLIRPWPLHSRQDSLIIDLPTGISAHCAPAILPDGDVVVAGEDGLHRVNIQEQTVRLLASDVPHEHVTVSADGRLLICGDSKSNRTEARTVHEASLSAEPLWSVDGIAPDQLLFSPDETRIAVVDWTNDSVVVLDSQRGEKNASLPASQCWAAA